jgi:hypothetical protein
MNRRFLGQPLGPICSAPECAGVLFSDPLQGPSAWPQQVHVERSVLRQCENEVYPAFSIGGDAQDGQRIIWRTLTADTLRHPQMNTNLNRRGVRENRILS